MENSLVYNKSNTGNGGKRLGWRERERETAEGNTEREGAREKKGKGKEKDTHPYLKGRDELNEVGGRGGSGKKGRGGRVGRSKTRSWGKVLMMMGYLIPSSYRNGSPPPSSAGFGL